MSFVLFLGEGVLVVSAVCFLGVVVSWLRRHSSVAPAPRTAPISRRPVAGLVELTFAPGSVQRAAIAFLATGGIGGVHRDPMAAAPIALAYAHVLDWTGRHAAAVVILVALRAAAREDPRLDLIGRAVERHLLARRPDRLATGARRASEDQTSRHGVCVASLRALDQMTLQ